MCQGMGEGVRTRVVKSRRFGMLRGCQSPAGAVGSICWLDQDQRSRLKEDAGAVVGPHARTVNTDALDANADGAVDEYGLAFGVAAAGVQPGAGAGAGAAQAGLRDDGDLAVVVAGQQFDRLAGACLLRGPVEASPVRGHHNAGQP